MAGVRNSMELEWSAMCQAWGREWRIKGSLERLPRSEKGKYVVTVD